MIPSALQQVQRRLRTLLPLAQLRSFATMSGSSQQYTITSTVKLNNGLEMPRFGLGTWRSEKGKVRTVVKEAILAGYIHLDCAYAYGNHNEVGEGFKEALKESNGKIKREDIWVTTKLWCNAHEPSRAKAQVDEMLKDLQLDYLDLLLIHWPSSWKPESDGSLIPDKPQFDDSHTIKDTWQALEKIVESGKVKSIGISNYTEQETEEILGFAKIKPAINQSESHPYFNNHELLKWNVNKGIHFTAYSPLGNVSADKVDESPLKHPVITEIAKKHNKSTAQVIIRWHLQNGAIVIPKTVSPQRVKENAQVFDFELSQDEIQKINGLDKGAEGRLVNPKFRPGGKTNFAGPGSIAEN